MTAVSTGVLSASGALAAAIRHADEHRDAPANAIADAILPLIDIDAAMELAASHLAAAVDYSRRADARAAEHRAIERDRERAEKHREANRVRYQERRAEEAREIARYGHVRTADERMAEINANLAACVQAYEDQMRVKITAELLATTFALGDGTSVTWGRATIADHPTRIDMLMVHVTGTMETAARHGAAIRTITAAGVQCLGDLPISA